MNGDLYLQKDRVNFYTTHIEIKILETNPNYKHSVFFAVTLMIVS